MKNEQSTFDAFGDPSSGRDPPESEAEEGGPYLDKHLKTPRPAGKLSCPWCLAPASDFRENRMGQTGCGWCSAVIPLDSMWYRNGDKICL